MNRLKEQLAAAAAAAGAAEVGFAAAGEVDRSYADTFARWLSSGCHASMEYMASHQALRANPLLLLADEGENPPSEGSLLVCAFSCYSSETPQGDVTFAMYARGTDYHEVLRRRLQPVAKILHDAGYRARICVDSAPVAEKYWAVKAGVGFIGRNGLLITPRCGTYLLLAEIITDAPLPPDPSCTDSCLGCGRCMKSCPAGAIAPGGIIDSRRCLSYLTIEKKGEWSDMEMAQSLTHAPGGCIYGCDVCQQVCPHNRHADPSLTVPELRMRPSVGALTHSEILSLTQERFSAIFTHSAVKRAKLAGLQRNARVIPPASPSERK